MVATNVRTDLSLKGGLQLKEAAGFPSQAGAGATSFQGGVLYVRGEVSGVKVWFPINAPQGHYVHKQGANASVWVARHGFGDAVAVMAYSPQGEVIAATVTNSAGVASIDVGGARTGYAVVFGLAYASASHNHDSDYVSQQDFIETLTQLAAAFEHGATEIAAITISSNNDT